MSIVHCELSIKKDGPISIYILPKRPIGEFAYGNSLRDCRDIHRITEAGIHQRRNHARVVRRFGTGLFLAAFGVEWASKSQQIREDSAIAGVWSLGMALGVIFIFLTPGYAPNLSAYLFGNILTISPTDIGASAGLVLALLAFFGLYLREIVYIAFDPNFAQTQRLPVKVFEYVMMCFIAITIVLSIRMVGIMLLMSLLTLPQITVNLLTSDYRKIMWGSMAIAFIGSIVGLVLSYYLNIPSGAFIILVLVLFFLIVKCCKKG